MTIAPHTVSIEEWRALKALRDCAVVRAPAVGSVFERLSHRLLATAADVPHAPGKRDYRIAERGSGFLLAYGALPAKPIAEAPR